MNYTWDLMMAMVDVHYEEETKKYHTQLLEGLDPHQQDDNGQSLLHHVVVNGNYKCVELLSTYHVDMNLQDKDGKTPLHVASMMGHFQCVEQLLKCHADPTIRDKDGASPLHIASRGRDKIKDLPCFFHGSCVEKLLTYHGANDSQPIMDPNIQDNEGKTPLHYASRNGNHTATRILLKAHANPNIQDQDGWTPLHKIDLFGYCVADLLKYRANPNLQDNYGKTSLHMMTIIGITKSCILLLKYRADPQITDHNGMSAIDIAKKLNREDLIKLFDSFVSNKQRYLNLKC